MRASTFATLLAVFGLFPSLSAAAIVGVYTPLTNTDVDFDLTALGTSDWAYWHTTAGSGAGAKTNEKASGSLISNLSPIGGGDLRGSSSAYQGYDFIFIDGTSPASGPQNNVIGVFNTQLQTANTGVSLGVLMPELGVYTINLWVGAFNDTGRLTASAPGMTSYVDSSLVGNGTGTPRQGALYTLTVSPQNAGDTLTLAYDHVNTGTTNAHVLIAGAAVSFTAIPEPSTIALSGFGIVVLGMYWRKRRQHTPGNVIA